MNSFSAERFGWCIAHNPFRSKTTRPSLINCRANSSAAGFRLIVAALGRSAAKAHEILHRKTSGRRNNIGGTFPSQPLAEILRGIYAESVASWAQLVNSSVHIGL